MSPKERAWSDADSASAVSSTCCCRLLRPESPQTLRGLRDHAMVALLLGCGLRRGEVLALELQSVQQREEHWVIGDLLGEAGHVRTVQTPHWVKANLDAWTTAAGLTRAINKADRMQEFG